MRLLLAEDEQSLSKALVAILEGNHYSVDAVYDGVDALAYLDAGNYDALILDIMMPKLDGLSVLRKLRASGNQIPVLDSGANDYLAKPFAARELLTRIRAMTRSKNGQADVLLQAGNITLNCASFEVSSPYGSFRLPNKEYQMLEMLLRSPSSLIPAERFFEIVWGYDSDAEINVIWVHISRLRKKLAELQADVEIAASRNAGYYLKTSKAQPK